MLHCQCVGSVCDTHIFPIHFTIFRIGLEHTFGRLPFGKSVYLMAVHQEAPGICPILESQREILEKLQQQRDHNDQFNL